MPENVLEVKKGRRTMHPIVRRLLVFALCLYALPLVVLYGFQRQLIFHARKSAPTTPPTGAKQISLRTDTGETVAALYGHAMSAESRPDSDYAHRPTLLFFYGKGSTLASSHRLFQSLRRLDINVLMPDYVGFGQSSGEASETGCYASATACWRYLRTRPDVDQKILVIAGFSLGSGVAVDLAARETAAGEPVAGLALFAPYTSMADEAHQEYPVYPTALFRWLMKYQFRSEAKMPSVRCPVLIVHSRADQLIPFSMSDRMAAVCGGPVTRLVLLNADHGSYFTRDGATLFPALGHFLSHALTK